MYSRRYNFVFVHIPKTAGTSMLNVLAPYAEGEVRFNDATQQRSPGDWRDPELRLHKHATIQQYHQRLGKKFVEQALVFTVIRNPWDRLISDFHAPYRQHEDRSLAAFRAFIPQVRDARHYLSLNQRRDWRRRLAGWAIPWLPRGSSWRLDGAMDLVLRFEKLEDDFAKLCRRLGIPEVTLPHVTRSARGPYQEHYDRSCRELVYRHFREEIEYFGYRFD